MNIDRQLIFPAGTWGQSHASTLVELADGTVVCSWFAGTRESAKDVSIYTAVCRGACWTTPLQINRVCDKPHWNSVLFVDNSMIHLFYKTGPSPASWITWYSTCRDGKEWSIPVELVPGDETGRGPVKNKPILLNDGSWCAPGSLENNERWEAFVDLSTDRGQSWKMFMVPMDGSDFKAQKVRGVIQPSLWESDTGHIHMLLRSTEGFVFRSDSVDGGKTWTPVKPVSMPNNNSGLDVARRKDGLLAMVCNPVKGNWAARTPLTLFLSKDNGLTWEKAVDLETEKGEFSYPAVVFSSSGELLATYTWKRQSIAFCRISL